MNVKKAAVLGAGTMGAAIAAHLSNAGIPTLLLDIAPKELNENEQKKSLPLDSFHVRNRIVGEMFDAAKKLKPAPFMVADNANLISIGNFEDDLEKLKDCDFVIEAVVENLDIKHKLFAEVEKNMKPGAVIASNTSGIPISSIAEPFSDEFKKHFVGVHFFNPPRYMKLVEVIPTEDTDKTVEKEVGEFLDTRLGKGVVPAKDRPNFIANRIGVFSMMASIKEMIEMGLTPTEVDQITGKGNRTRFERDVSHFGFSRIGCDGARCQKSLSGNSRRRRPRGFSNARTHQYFDGKEDSGRQNERRIFQKIERRRRQARDSRIRFEYV